MKKKEENKEEYLRQRKKGFALIRAVVCICYFRSVFISFFFFFPFLLLSSLNKGITESNRSTEDEAVGDRINGKLKELQSQTRDRFPSFLLIIVSFFSCFSCCSYISFDATSGVWFRWHEAPFGSFLISCQVGWLSWTDSNFREINSFPNQMSVFYSRQNRRRLKRFFSENVLTVAGLGTPLLSMTQIFA